MSRRSCRTLTGLAEAVPRNVPAGPRDVRSSTGRVDSFLHPDAEELAIPTSLADQTVEQLGGLQSVLAAQRRDHVRLDELLTHLEASTGEDEEEVLQRVARLVFPHAFAEESVLWPVLRRVLADGEELTRQVEQEHQEVNELYVALETGEHDGDERARLLARLAEVLREDVRDEEDVLLPRLQEAVSVEELRRLGVAWRLVSRVAPTRPHPVVARRPPGNVVAALPLTALDRSRDALDALARRTTRGSGALRSASGALARSAGLVERLPLMRRGEDSSTSRLSPARPT